MLFYWVSDRPTSFWSEHADAVAVIVLSMLLVLVLLYIATCIAAALAYERQLGVRGSFRAALSIFADDEIADERLWAALAPSRARALRPATLEVRPMWASPARPSAWADETSKVTPFAPSGMPSSLLVTDLLSDDLELVHEPEGLS